jgi:hypothetical protein
MNAAISSSLASVPWKIIALAFLLSSFSADVQVDAFVPNVGSSSNQIQLSSPRLLRLSNTDRFAPYKLDSPTLVRSSSSRVSNIGNSINDMPSVPDSYSVPRWNLWKRLRNRISTPTSMSAAASVTGSSNSSVSVSIRSGSRWMKAAAAFATFLFLRPLTAVASGGGMGGGARTTPLPPLERYVLCRMYYTVMYSLLFLSVLELTSLTHNNNIKTYTQSPTHLAECYLVGSFSRARTLARL